MAIYYETRIRYDKMHDNGIVKKTTESFLVDALSFTEAEARITEEQRPYISGDFNVSAVKKTKIAEIYRDETGDKWYRCKIMFINIDEKSESEKRSPSVIMVQASNFRHAYDNLLDCMKGTVADYEIAEIVETKILDVYDAKLGTSGANNTNENESPE